MRKEEYAMTQDEVQRALFAREEHLAAETSVLLDLYKMHVETMERVMARRVQTGALFLTVDSLLFAGMGFCAKSFSTEPVALAAFVVIGLAGFSINLTWYLLLRYYRIVTGTKFEVIRGIESRLPARLFSTEWALFQERKHVPLARIEAIVPVIFAVLYGGLTIACMLYAYWI
jgi:hypothetical protein